MSHLLGKQLGVLRCSVTPCLNFVAVEAEFFLVDTFADCCVRCAVWWLLVGSLAEHALLCTTCGTWDWVWGIWIKNLSHGCFLSLINVFSVAVVCAVMAAVLLWTSCVRVTYASPGHGSVVFTVCFSMCGVCFGEVLYPLPHPIFNCNKKNKIIRCFCVS